MTVTSVDASSGIEISFDQAVFRHRLLYWYDTNGITHPWRDDWQNSRDPYRVWLSEIMLQQTVIKAVLPAYKRFTDQLPTIADLARADVEQVRMLVRGLGYYRRFGLFKKAADLLVMQSKDAREDDKINWPQNFSEWRELPGVGPYTAAALASITNNEPVAVVDGNVERVLCRLFNIHLPPNLPALKPTFKRLAQGLIAERPGDFNQALMELGQQVCRVSTPQCAHCPVRSFCLAYRAGSQAQAPQPKLKRKFIDVSLDIYLTLHNRKVGLVERPASAKFLRGTWGFVTSFAPGQGDGFEFDQILHERATAIGRFTHSITQHRIKANVHIVNEPTTDLQMRWLDVNEVEEQLIANLDRKAWLLVLKQGYLKNANLT